MQSPSEYGHLVYGPLNATDRMLAKIFVIAVIVAEFCGYVR